MQELFAVAAITLLAVVSPGGDFAMVTRNSYLYGRRAGIFTRHRHCRRSVDTRGLHAFGREHSAAASPNLFHAVKTLGAAYLVYIGYTNFLATAPYRPQCRPAGRPSAIGRPLKRLGHQCAQPENHAVLCSAPYRTQIVSPATPLGIQLRLRRVYVRRAFAVVCLCGRGALQPRLAQPFAAKTADWSNRIIGILLMGLGLMLMVAGSGLIGI